ncbi:hypothetical protein Pan241w_28670 [Gimesia alba]|uniref:Uncharacterized protein n=1 Tax=Gimesia alba TaxID=2527973 RepID=A0A517RFX6_9PLAN|nr:hypothetical protein [Gimesia alba]QDT42778.1 hypothetical protein Pan241w_28670 [Gimesia alba]
MRRFIVLTVIVLSPFSNLWGDPELRPDPMLLRWKLFPGPNLSVNKLIPDADPQSSCMIESLIFASPKEKRSDSEHSRELLETVVPAETAFKIAEPDKAVKALISQHFSQDHRFKLDAVELVSHRQSGYRWNVIWSLWPERGGFTGVPFRYRVAVTARGELIVPDCYQFDSYALPKHKRWLCSLLKLEFPEVTKKQGKNEVRVKPTKKQIEERGIEALGNFLVKVNADLGGQPVQFHLLDCRAIELPMRVDPDGKMKTIKIWGVNFKQTLGPDVRKTKDFFTVWLSEYGTVSELKTVPVQW